MKSKLEMSIVLLSTLGIVILFCTQFSIFVIPSINDLSTSNEIVLISRLDNARFIDSTDAMCWRAGGEVNLLCRGRVAGNVTQNAKIFAKFPYSDLIYLLSTEGKRY